MDKFWIFKFCYIFKGKVILITACWFDTKLHRLFVNLFLDHIMIYLTNYSFHRDCTGKVNMSFSKIIQCIMTNVHSFLCYFFKYIQNRQKFGICILIDLWSFLEILLTISPFLILTKSTFCLVILKKTLSTNHYRIGKKWVSNYSK